MKRTNTESVGELIRQYLRQQGLEAPLNEYRLIQGWSYVMGPVVARAILLSVISRFMYAFLLQLFVRNFLCNVVSWLHVSMRMLEHRLCAISYSNNI